MTVVAYYLLLALFLANDVHGSLKIMTGSAANQSFYCTSTMYYRGPQPNPDADPVFAHLHNFEADPCDSETFTSADVQGKAVFVKATSCSEDLVYYNMAMKGAAAVIRRGSFQPGSDYYVKTYRSHEPSRTDMLYVNVPPSALDPGHLYENALVSITPDPNIWLPYFRSLTWQLFLRWVPGVCFSLGFVLAVTFLFGHINSTCNRYYQQAPPSLASRKMALLYSFDRFDSIQLGLLIETFNCPLLAVYFLYGGFYSTPNLPEEMQRFFVTQLSGLTFLTTMISARVWYRSTTRHSRSKTCLSRVFPGSSGRRRFFILTGIPVGFDLAISLLYILYIPNKYPILDFAVGGVITVLKVFVGFLLLSQTSKFLLGVHRSTNAIDDYAANQTNSDIKTSLFFQTVFALGVGVSITMGVAGSLLIVVAPKYFSLPQGYMTSFSLMSTGHGMETVFHIMIFRPVIRFGLQNVTKTKTVSTL